MPGLLCVLGVGESGNDIERRRLPLDHLNLSIAEFAVRIYPAATLTILGAQFSDTLLWPSRVDDGGRESRQRCRRESIGAESVR